MEEMIAGIMEKTLVGGAFIYLLHYFIAKNNVTMESIAKSLENVANTLLKMDIRLEQLEKRIHELEEKQ